MRSVAGFSMMELMTVLAIVAILSTMAVPALFQWGAKHRVGNAARDVKSTLEFARINAIKTNADVTVNFDWANERMTVAAGGTTLSTLQMPGDVDLLDVDLGTPVTFNGHGFSSDSGQVRVENSKDPTLARSIILNLGGTSRIE